MEETGAPQSEPAALDDALVRALANDLDRAFPGLVEAHGDRLYTIALRMLGDPGDAEEAAQDALVRAYRALASYDAARIGELRLRGWLATIVLNRCRSQLTRRAGRGSSVPLDATAGQPSEPVAPTALGPEATALRHDDRDAWARRLARLPAAYRAAVILRHVDGLSYPEAAAALGRPEGTVKAQVHRGIALLRTMLEADRGLGPEEMTA